MLCEVCIAAFTLALATTGTSYSERRHARLTHHPSTASFKKSAREGCYVCSRHVRSVRLTNSDEYVVTRTPLSDDNCEHELFVGCDEVWGKTTLFKLLEASQVAASLSEASLSATSTGSHASTRLVKHWLSTCLNEHTTCAKNLTPTWYPSRLLDVSGSSIYLISTAKTKPRACYVTMSHCWGTQPFETLSTYNMDSFQEGLPLLWFPKTFRDAIKLVRRLGLRYLWIDCYCILQNGDPNDVSMDKVSELPTIHNVYANSYLNIGATHSSGPFDGCFVQRDRNFFRDEYGFRDGLGNPRTHYAELEHAWLDLHAGAGTRLYQIVHDRYHEALQRSLCNDHALFKRAWVLQERMLSPRMLHFGKNQLHWECSGYGYASEEFPHGSTPKPVRPTLPPFSLTYDWSVPSEFSASTGTTLWRDIVREYSLLSLSYPREDKLIALGGIAERAAQLLDDTYIAGFFKSRIMWDLYFEWREHMRPLGFSLRQEVGHDAQDLPGPSWSWASRMLAVSFPPVWRTQLLAKLHRYDVQLVDPNVPYGAVSASKLEITCRPIDIHIVDADEYAAWATADNVQDGFTVILDGLPPLWKRYIGLTFQILFLYRMALSNDTSSEDVLTAHKTPQSGVGPPFVRLYGLVLRKGVDGSYRRVGVLGHVHISNRVALQFLRIWDNQPDTLLTLH